MTVRDILVAAQALLAVGWTQGVHEAVIDGRKCYCPVGALVAASGSDHLDNDAWSALSQAIGRVGIVVWNDRPERTQADVLAAFDRAIARTS